ncbi:short-chain dehydrogenase/reductase SDR [Rahnella aceris]|jgi:3-oxoacyl-[acyl-carrier protein] reductase|uniref:Short-chain dehydrogenase/reductase SDR n=1 Tax=Rahnella sp. (strain Y9602) TaxID=2703885 RepID=A0A0H3FAX1_RAHSY|nr:SDR family oxidoreductase [Rahnella aceris]ADW73290.1 short-chain dehydrogenase/reductase SDR [Rahnella aceris]AFE57860.1 short-chain dehydrogenase/reductase SDR [Rahnella aquatilis HX2]MBU9841598.1 SDR family oxidoreductase [Rahnella aceris]MBU9859464.1 SDR family oxidoreductase [Rahnella aceris]
MDFGIQGRVALVSGAGGGLGRAMAIALAGEGVQVAVCGRTLSALQETVSMIEKQGGTAQAWVLDLTAPESFDDVLMQIRRTFGPVGILINNSGGPPPTKAAGVAPDAWQSQFSTMVSSLIQLTDKVLPDMHNAGWGRIITSTSSGVIAPIANLGMSNTLRMALAGWSKTLASEVAGDGITVNVMVPGRISTQRLGQLDAARAGREGTSVEEVAAKSAASIPAKRYGKTEEYGAVAAFLASQQASYVTGSVIRVDGGMIPSI